MLLRGHQQPGRQDIRREPHEEVATGGEQRRAGWPPAATNAICEGRQE